MDTNEDIAAAVRAVSAKPDSRHCCPGRWRVTTCPMTGMVVIEKPLSPIRLADKAARRRHVE